jgi:predicted RNA methylase
MESRQENKVDQDYFRFYADYKLHAEMLRDTARVHAYKNAIDRHGMQGKVVIDVGCGTGILAALCAKAGMLSNII